jgi:hydroxypyruvate reductase
LNEHVTAIVRTALAGVHPAHLVERALRAEPPTANQVCLLAVGKASVAMAVGACAVLGERVTRGLVIGPVDASVPEPLTYVRADHPMPSQDSEHAGRAALALASSPGPADALLVLVSGGASALMAVPASGLTLEDKQRTTERLLRAGVTIHELNTVRKHLSAVKGGRLAAASPVRVIALAISDVVGDDPTVIGSGPTVADASTYVDALAVIDRTGGRDAYPVAVVTHLERGARAEPGVPETPKPGGPRLATAEWHLIGGRREAMQSAAEAARACGYAVDVHDEPVTGDARTAAAQLGARVTAALSRSGPVCLISSGETTVHVRGRGLGGRNQEFALALAERASTWTRPVVVASVGTDGVDGPTDAAGAIVRSDTLSRAADLRLRPPSAFLADNDAYHFFEPLNDLIRTGPSGTNVGDLQVCLVG